jgi:zinc/manganese transport system ATP-binding protein
MIDKENSPIIRLTAATLGYGRRTLWKELNLTVQPGEFITILGPNGTGKTSLLKVLLGLQQLQKGSVHILNEPPKRGNPHIGYIPQQKAFDPDLPIRGRDLVHFGLDGHRYGFGRHKAEGVERVAKVIQEVGAQAYADLPIGLLSGGEQQRLRIAQSLLAKPSLLLCDEPLLSLDIKQQEAISELIDSYRRQFNTAVMFVTHDINPVLDMVDRVLYLVDGKWLVGTPKEVLTSQSLSELYGAPIDVLHVRDRLIVVNTREGEGLNGQHHVHDHETGGGA